MIPRCDGGLQRQVGGRGEIFGARVMSDDCAEYRYQSGIGHAYHADVVQTSNSGIQWSFTEQNKQHEEILPL